jgi:hypothetical protein
MSLNQVQTQLSGLTLRGDSTVNSEESHTRVMTENSSNKDVLQNRGQPQQEEPRAMTTSQAQAQILSQQQISGADQPPEFYSQDRAIPLGVLDSMSYLQMSSQELQPGQDNFLPNQPVHSSRAVPTMPSPYFQTMPIPCSICGQQGHNQHDCAHQAATLRPPAVHAHTLLPRHMPRPKEPQVFSGTRTEDVRQWVHAFRGYCQLTSMSGPAHLMILHAAQFLMGEASDWEYSRSVSDVHTPLLSLDQWLEALIKRFTAHECTESMRLRFVYCRQDKHDMITYVQQARSAYHAARRVGEIIADSGAIDIFCLNMSDRKIVGRIYKAHSRNKCLSFEEVLDMALKFAQEDILEYPGPQPMQPAHWPQQVHQARGFQQVQQPRQPRQLQQAQVLPRSVPPEPPTCYNCGVKGHMSRECKAPSKKRARPLAVHCADVAEQNHPSVVRQERHLSDEVHDMIMQHGGCTHCGLTYADCGHIRKYCPFLPNQLNEEPQ